MAYAINMKMFALGARREGKGWGEIRKLIREKFKVDPPSLRALQLWEKETDQGVFSQAFKVQAQKEAANIKEQALSKVAEELLPRLWQAKEAGEDIEYEGWRWFFSILESNLGQEKFNRFINRYLQERPQKTDSPTS